MKLVRRFQDRSIRVRLSLLIVLNSGVALALAGVGLFGYESIQQRRAVTRELSTEARVLAGSAAAALRRGDVRAATEMLAALRDDSGPVEAIVYGPDNRPFARYGESAVPAESQASPARRAGIYFEDGSVLVFEPVKRNGERIGTVFLKSANDVRIRLRRYIVIVCLVLSLSLGLALLLSSRTQKAIAEPIAELSAIARRVSSGTHNSVRATPGAGGEIGVLIESFNHMLSQLGAREESLRESEERYALAARGSNDGLWDWKRATNKLYVSPRFTQMLGYPGDDGWTNPEAWFSQVHPSDRDRVRAAFALHIEGKTEELVTEYRMRHKNGGFIWMRTRGIAVRDATGTAVRIAGSQTDITDNKMGDPLTGLPSGLFLLDRLDSALDDAPRRGETFALLILDLDRFKLINDSLGHAAGNELLMDVAGRLRSSARTFERAAGARPCVVARLGGDEFAMLLPDIRDEAGASVIARLLLQEIEAPFAISGHQVFATVSIGIAMSSSADTAEDILRNADTAMYHAKSRGKARFAVFNAFMRERATARLETETGLRKAIAARQLVLNYQPQVSLRNQRITGYEALVRWNHPRRGIISPEEFIPVAEESDLIVDLGRVVLSEACAQMAQWHKIFAFDPPLTVAVNVSPKQLSDAGFVRDVERILIETGLNPRCLKLEMTESSVMGNPETTLATLRQLRRLNIGLEIDDFGTGYSSLSYLQKLPFDTVKIDRSFIRELATDDESFEIVRTIVELARSLNMQVIAEGVETRNQLETLAYLGCNCVQGFYFSKPLSAQATQALMRERLELERAFETLQRGEVRASRTTPPEYQDVMEPLSESLI